ncbi:hypothetical protein AcW1_001102 [Taiwanofungus camphoratus]|nr:hypothetical protein AcW2_000385 [Antrodia cinnamomea]KAI0937023.1 hypothetical protein AcV5_005019 [Antrodia cinnamomea]KAI0962245.1 hypothetical protein AcV7_001126 [Antrodia cinnamomea]KAI0964239.1 hypothetical protein AcW1_001102 [Antrodia cinnamomea]
MPLLATRDPAAPSTLRGEVKEDFLIFYASRDETGKLWCPDCIAIDNLVNKAFGPADGPTGLIVYVGQRAEWKSMSNPFRKEPWTVESVPTIIRVRDGARLVDKEIERSLVSFLQG